MKFYPGLSPDYCGTLPFSFLSWGAYSVYLVSKIGVIFSSQIPAFMTDFEGTQSKEGESFYDIIFEIFNDRFFSFISSHRGPGSRIRDQPAEGHNRSVGARLHYHASGQ